MGKARRGIRVSAPSGSAKLAATKLRDAETIGEITEAYCLALFLPCWMYPTFRQRVVEEYEKLPASEKAAPILPPPKVTAPKPTPPPPKPTPPPPAPVVVGPIYGWTYSWSPLTPGIPIPELFGSDVVVDEFFRKQYPEGTRFREKMAWDPAYAAWSGQRFAV